MRANPYCLRTMAAFSDWLQERGDPRWEPLAWLAENGRVGSSVGYRDESWAEHEVNKPPQSYIPHEWYARAIGVYWMHNDYDDNITNRMWLLTGWLPADTQVPTPPAE